MSDEYFAWLDRMRSYPCRDHSHERGELQHRPPTIGEWVEVVKPGDADHERHGVVSGYVPSYGDGPGPKPEVVFECDPRRRVFRSDEVKRIPQAIPMPIDAIEDFTTPRRGLGR
jgi:hypothetical protein